MAREIVQGDIPVVKQILSAALGCSEYTSVDRLGGLTNHTYLVTLAETNKAYVVRIPGEGTEEMIVRQDEKVSTQLANDLGIDAPLVYFGDDGAKVAEYIPNAITMSPDTLKEAQRTAKVAAVLKTLHTCGKSTGVPFEVFDMAEGYEKIIFDKKVDMYPDYREIKQTVMDIKAEIDGALEIQKVPCHNDPLCENWVEGDGKMYLIDWEYAGMNDGFWDLAAVSIEAVFDGACDEHLLCEYLGREPDVIDRKHFLASKIYVDYLWTLWAKARVPYDGQPMEDWALQRYTRLKKFICEYKAL